MHSRYLLALPALLIGVSALGGCTPAVVPQPARPVAVPTPEPIPAPTPSPTPTPSPLSADWRDWPMTPGSWVYRQDARGSIALFGQIGRDAELTLRCDTARRSIYLSRRGEGNGALTVRTSSTLRSVNALPTGGTPAYVAVELTPRDSLLDAIGYSRGRFIVEGAGLPTLVIPAWGEVLRVIEDCR